MDEEPTPSVYPILCIKNIIDVTVKLQASTTADICSRDSNQAVNRHGTSLLKTAPTGVLCHPKSNASRYSTSRYSTSNSYLSYSISRTDILQQPQYKTIRADPPRKSIKDFCGATIENQKYHQIQHSLRGNCLDIY